MAFVATKGNSPEAWNPTWPSYWVLCVILITQFVVFEGLAYVKDRLYTRPLPYTKTRFSTRRKNNLDEDVLRERERVLALFEDGEKEEEEVVESDPSLVQKVVSKVTAVKDALLDELSDPNYYAPRIKMDAAPVDPSLVAKLVSKVTAVKDALLDELSD